MNNNNRVTGARSLSFQFSSGGSDLNTKVSSVSNQYSTEAKIDRVKEDIIVGSPEKRQPSMEPVQGSYAGPEIHIEWETCSDENSSLYKTRVEYFLKNWPFAEDKKEISDQKYEMFIDLFVYDLALRFEIIGDQVEKIIDQLADMKIISSTAAFMLKEANLIIKGYRTYCLNFNASGEKSTLSKLLDKVSTLILEPLNRLVIPLIVAEGMPIDLLFKNFDFLQLSQKAMNQRGYTLEKPRTPFFDFAIEVYRDFRGIQPPKYLALKKNQIESEEHFQAIIQIHNPQQTEERQDETQILETRRVVSLDEIKKDFFLTLGLRATTEDFHRLRNVSQIAIISEHWNRYLRSEIVEALLDNDTNLLAAGPGTQKLLLEKNGFWFNTRTIHPMMEYAISCFFLKLAGYHLSPFYQLACFKLHGECYTPVLIAKSFEGKSLKEVLETANPSELIDWRSWTWLLIGTLLTRPGSGTLSNYRVDQKGKVYSIHNEISFVEPLIRKNGKIQFCSALFCLFKDKVLDLNVLNEFCTLDSLSFLSNWVEELIKQEAVYEKLFEKIDTADLFYHEQHKGFLPFLQIRQGTLATLQAQFVYLQYKISEAIKKKQNLTGLDLLSFILNLDKEELLLIPGDEVARCYAANDKESSDKHLRRITGSSEEKFPTLDERDVLCFGKSRTYHECVTKKVFSLTDARKELLVLSDAQNELFMRADFDKILMEHQGDIKREIAILRSMISLPLLTNRKIRYLSLRNCNVLNANWLLKVVDFQLETLHLKCCPSLTSKDIELLAQFSHLQSLIIDDCQGLTSISQGKLLSSAPLHFEKLNQLHLRRCKHLEKILIRAPMLISFEESDHPKLNKIAITSIAFMPPYGSRISHHLDLETLERGSLADPEFSQVLMSGMRGNPQIAAIIQKKDHYQDFILNFVKQDGMNLRFVDQAMQDNHEIVLDAVTQQPLAIQFASPRLKDDVQLVLRAVKRNGLALEYASFRLRSNAHVVLCAVQQNGLSLKYAALKLRGDFTLIVPSAIKQNRDAQKFIAKPEELREEERNKQYVD